MKMFIAVLCGMYLLLKQLNLVLKLSLAKPSLCSFVTLFLQRCVHPRDLLFSLFIFGLCTIIFSSGGSKLFLGHLLFFREGFQILLDLFSLHQKKIDITGL